MSSEVEIEIGEMLTEQPLGDECENPTCRQIADTASNVYCEITGGLLSYPTYDTRTILTYADAETQKLIDQELADVERQRAALEQERDDLVLRLERALCALGEREAEQQ